MRLRSPAKSELSIFRNSTPEEKARRLLYQAMFYPTRFRQEKREKRGKEKKDK